MTAALSDAPPPPPDGWTTDDLDALPEDGYRRELIDGVFHVSPTPTPIHQDIAARLTFLLQETCPPEYAVTQGVEVRISKERSFVLDVLALIAVARDRQDHKYPPHEVVLAVEIVSKTSLAMDRIAKPALYAQAGIPFYWRIETKPQVTVHAYRLDPVGEIYVPVDSFTDTIELDEPWRIEVPIARLTVSVADQSRATRTAAVRTSWPSATGTSTSQHSRCNWSSRSRG